MVSMEPEQLTRDLLMFHNAHHCILCHCENVMLKSQLVQGIQANDYHLNLCNMVGLHFQDITTDYQMLLHYCYCQ